MIEMLQTAKQKLTVGQTQYDWILFATDTDQYYALEKTKQHVRDQLEHAKGNLTKEEQKQAAQDMNLKPSLGRANGETHYLDDIDKEPRKAKPMRTGARPQGNPLLFEDQLENQEERKGGGLFQDTDQAP